MIVKCSDCQASYSVDDSKVTNKKFGFSCPKCGANVIIDNRAIESDVELPLAPEVRTTSSPSVDNENLFSSDNTPLSEDTVSLQGMPNESEISSLLNEVEGQIKSKTKTNNEIAVPKSDDFMDFDLSSDDEQILRGSENIDKDKNKPATAVIDEDESISLDDFDSTESLEISEDKSSSDNNLDINLDDLTDNELALQVSSRPTKMRSSASSDNAFDSTHVSQDDFKPLEEDLILDDLPHASTNSNDTTTSNFKNDIKSEDILKDGSQVDTDESITIDLDSLDIQLDDTTPIAKAGETPPAENIFVDSPSAITSSKTDLPLSAINEEDQDITLDLDTLDITLDEVEEFKEGVSIDDEDEKLTLEDAGITLDQLETEGAESTKSEYSVEPEDELKLSIDEIDPSIRLDDLEKESTPSEHIISEINSDDLPEIDFDKLEAVTDSSSVENASDSLLISSRSNISSTSTTSPKKEDFLDIESKENYTRYQEDLEKYGSEPRDTVPKGTINFSIDYSLSHSRLKALLRIISVYFIALIPHFITLLVYSMLSSILGFINWIIVLFSGQYIDDFINVQEKTIRYSLSLAACSTAVVDEMPVYTGNEDIDHALQFSVTYPSKPSRLLAFLRISVIGMYIILLPHFILLFLLSLGAIIITFIGIVSVISIKRWPNILFDFMVRYFRYYANIISYWIGLVDKYPTFRFE